MHNVYGRYRVFWLLLVAALGLAWGPATKAEAATYYVSPAGSDAQSGTKTPSAWKTLAKVNSALLRPGDRVLFQRGGQWRESLTIQCSGTTEKPIIYADYGGGAKPKFWGSIALNKAQFFALGGTIYGYKTDLPLNALLADHQFLIDSLGQPVESVHPSYSWSAGLLKINSDSDPRVDNRQYTACVREDVIGSNGHSHLVFRNLVIDESAKFGGGYGIRIMDSQDVKVEGCEVYRAGKHHFACINSTQVVFRNCYAAYALPHQGFGGHSAFVSFGDSKSLPRQSSQYFNCTFEHSEDLWNGDHPYYIFVSHGASLGSVLLQDMVSRGAPLSVNNSESGATIQIIGGLLENNRLELDGQNLMVDGLKLTGPKATVDMNASNSVLQNLRIEGTNLGTAWYQTAVLSRKPGNTVRFCRILVARDAPDFNTCLAGAEACTNFRYYRNTLISNGQPFKDWGNSSVAEDHDNAHLLWKFVPGAKSPAK